MTQDQLFAEVDKRLSTLEREQREINIRLHLLEVQSDPRGQRKYGHD